MSAPSQDERVEAIAQVAVRERGEACLEIAGIRVMQKPLYHEGDLVSLANLINERNPATARLAELESLVEECERVVDLIAAKGGLGFSAPSEVTGPFCALLTRLRAQGEVE